MCLCFQGQAPPPPPLLTQAHSGATGLSLYPILWQYPNGTPTSYPPGLNLPPTSKWVHPENPVTVNSEASLRRVGLKLLTCISVCFAGSEHEHVIVCLFDSYLPVCHNGGWMDKGDVG